MNKPLLVIGSVIVGLLLNISLVQAESVLLDKVIAIVEEDIVMQSELDSRLVSISNRLRAQGTPLPPQDILKKRVLEQLVLESIQLQMADTAGIRVNDTQLNETIRNIAKSNRMTIEQFERQLALEGETYANAREQIRRELIITRVQQREVARRVRVTEQEIQNFLSSKEGRAKSGLEYNLAHIRISIKDSSPQGKEDAKARAEKVLSLLKSGADFKQVAVEYSDGRQALDGGVIGWRKETELPSIAADIIPALDVREPSELIVTGSGYHIVTVLEKRGGAEQIITQRRVRHILISPNDIRSDDESKAKIDLLYERIVGGDDFAELAKSNSDDPVSAIDGGDLSWVSPGQMVPEFERTSMSTPIGQVSKPFRSKFGWHILEVLEEREQDIGALIQANQAQQVIHRRKYEEELANWLLEIKGEAFIEIKEPGLEIDSIDS